MILVDSSVWIDYFRGSATPPVQKLDTLLGSVFLAIGDLILLEVLQGFRDQQEFKHARALLTSMTVISLGGKAIAIQAAENFRLLRRLGLTVRKTIDCIIATHCIVNKYTLVHNDRDFEPFITYLGLVSFL